MSDNSTDKNLVRSDRFIFVNNVFTTELSSLGPDFKFDVDAHGIPSFKMRSMTTNGIAHFFFIVDSRNTDNEVMSWTFRCSEPGLKHLTAVIIND